MMVPEIEQVCTKYRTSDSPFVMSLHNIQLRVFWLEEICSYCTHTVNESIYLITLSKTVICLIAKYNFHLILLQSCLWAASLFFSIITLPGELMRRH